MAPTKFWRVVDEDSRSRWRGGRLLAGSPYTRIEFNFLGQREKRRLIAELVNHLNWGNPKDTEFISVYSDKRRAMVEAERRVLQGKRNVRIIEINTLKARRRSMQYRNVRELAKKLDVWIEDEAYHNSEHEYIFLHHIEQDAMVRTFSYKRSRLHLLEHEAHFN